MIQNTELLNLINKLRKLYNKNTESELYTKLQLSTFYVLYQYLSIIIK